MRRPLRLALAGLAVVLGGCGVTLPSPSVPDDPSTVRVIVFEWTTDGQPLTVWFPTSPDDGGGNTAGVTRGEAVSCYVIPVGARVAVIGRDPTDIRRALYVARAGDPDQILWVQQSQDGTLAYGEGMPTWARTSPRCDGVAGPVMP